MRGLLMLGAIIVLGLFAWSALATAPTPYEEAAADAADQWEKSNCVGIEPDHGDNYPVGTVVGNIGNPGPNHVSVHFSPDAASPIFSLGAGETANVVVGGDFADWYDGGYVRICRGRECGWVLERRVCWVP